MLFEILCLNFIQIQIHPKKQNITVYSIYIYICYKLNITKCITMYLLCNIYAAILQFNLYLKYIIISVDSLYNLF